MYRSLKQKKHFHQKMIPDLWVNKRYLEQTSFAPENDSFAGKLLTKLIRIQFLLFHDSVSLFV